MTITTEYIKELRELFFDVAEDSNKTELRIFLQNLKQKSAVKLLMKAKKYVIN